MRIFLSQPHGERLGDLLLQRLRDPSWQIFRAAVAFVKRSGVKHLVDELRAFASRAQVKMAVGVDLGGTSLEGLSALFEALEGHGEVWVVHNANGSTFHPKLYLFKNATHGEVIVGSGNLTEGGLFDNYEAAVAVSLDLADAEDQTFLAGVEAVLDTYGDETSGTSIRLTRETLDALTLQGYLPPEAFTRRAEEAPALPPGDDDAKAWKALFDRVPVPSSPRLASRAGATAPAGRAFAAVVPAPPAGQGSVFYMTLLRTDAGAGQTTAGTQRRSPEIFVPLAARDFAPTFWEWPAGFTADAAKPGKLDRFEVGMFVGTSTESVTMTYFPHRHDFRLRSGPLRSAGAIGDILRIEKTDGSRGYQYMATVIPQGTSQYAAALAKCVNQVKASRKGFRKVWGYE